MTEHQISATAPDEILQRQDDLLVGMSIGSHNSLSRDPLPLAGKTIIMTGVSRRAGIGYATACRLAAYGANVFCHHFSPHDGEQPWGRDDINAVLEGVRSHLTEGAEISALHADLSEPSAAQQVIDAAVTTMGHIDALICNQALSGSDGPLGDLTSDMLDRHWQINARASILLTQAFAAQHSSERSGSVVLLTSGQGLGPMPGELAYAASKAALAGVTTTIADQLADQNIRVNTVNPGPVDTGYLTDDAWTRLSGQFPLGRFGHPDDPARLIAWLCTDEASWIAGQIINSEGGFRR